VKNTSLTGSGSGDQSIFVDDAADFVVAVLEEVRVRYVNRVGGPAIGGLLSSVLE
jgi:hypothetical protein